MLVQSLFGDVQEIVFSSGGFYLREVGSELVGELFLVSSGIMWAGEDVLLLVESLCSHQIIIYR